jgi:hypothetical protein
LQRWGFILAIKLKSERFAKGRERPFGGIGFCSLKGNVVDFAVRAAAPFARSMTFSDNGGAIGVHGNAHFGDIDGEERATGFSRQDATGVYGLAVPAVKTEDPVGLRDRIPAFDIGELATIDLASADVPVVEAARNACTCFAENPITASSRSKPVPGLTGQHLQRRRPLLVHSIIPGG